VAPDDESDATEYEHAPHVSHVQDSGRQLPLPPHALVNPAVSPAVTAVWLAAQIRALVNDLTFRISGDRSDELREWYAEEGVS
jgi:hypothetical protein